MKRIHVLVYITLLLLSKQVAYSQEFTWKAGYDFIADNREYFNLYGFPQTILNSRVSLELGFELDSNQTVMAGASYMSIHGNNQLQRKPDLIMYYDFHKPRFNAKFGSFPRTREYFPLLMYTDSVLYEQPNIQGALGSYWTKHFNQTMLIDWMRQVNNGQDEQFLVGLQGQINYAGFYVKDYIYYIHHASDTISGGKRLQDNFASSFYVGYNVANILDDFDSASVEVGTVRTTFAVRPDEPNESQGIHIRAHLMYQAFGLEYSHYTGQGTYLEFGDPLYRSGDYTRINFVFAPNLNQNAKSVFSKNTDSRVQFYFKYCMHFISGDYDNSQQIFVKIRLEK